MAGNIFSTSLVFIALLILIIKIFDFEDLGERKAAFILCLLAVSITSAAASLIAVIWK